MSPFLNGRKPTDGQYGKGCLMTFCLRETCSQMSAHTNAMWEAKSVLKSIQLDGTPQQVLKDVADMLVRLAIIFEKS